jgi:hypothetical protein
VNEINLTKLGIGLETINEDNNDLPFSLPELQERFNLIHNYSIQQIDIWRFVLE